MCDIARPVKLSAELNGYRDAEYRLQSAIAEKFGLSIVEPEEVSEIDTALLVTEARDLGLLTPEWPHYKINPLPFIIHPQPPKDAERCFLDWFKVVTRPSWAKSATQDTVECLTNSHLTAPCRSVEDSHILETKTSA